MLERLGYGSENATWRNCFLMGAMELRQGIQPTVVEAATGLAPAMSVTQLFDSVAIRIDGPKAWSTRFTINWHVTDVDEHYRMELSNGALVHFPTSRREPADLTITLERAQLLPLLRTGRLDGGQVEGRTEILEQLIELTCEPDPDFAVVTP